MLRILRSLFAGRSGGGIAPGTAADSLLASDVLFGLLIVDRLAAGVDSADEDPCRDRRVDRVEVLDPPVAAPGEHAGWSGPWVERWTLDRCGQQFAYVVEFSPADDGGTDWQIRDPVGQQTG